MTEITELLRAPSAYFRFPFRYSRDASAVFDSEDNMIVDVRGYGYLTGQGALGLPDREACAIQDQVGCAVANLLNAAWPKPEGTGYQLQKPA